jgi:hypothetical protein
VVADAVLAPFVFPVPIGVILSTGAAPQDEWESLPVALEFV